MLASEKADKTAGGEKAISIEPLFISKGAKCISQNILNYIWINLADTSLSKGKLSHITRKPKSEIQVCLDQGVQWPSFHIWLHFLLLFAYWPHVLFQQTDSVWKDRCSLVYFNSFQSKRMCFSLLTSRYKISWKAYRPC